MKTITFLACDTTLPAATPGSNTRREDAYEHDLMIAAIEPALAARGLRLRVLDWEAPISEFAGSDLVLLGTAWNYQDKADAFLDKLDQIEGSGITLCNPSAIARWNIRKTYLRKLEDAGIRTIPTLWREQVTVKGLREAFAIFECDRLVVKRQVGAGALGQELIARSSLPAADWSFGAPAMIQPYLRAIASEGELSFVFIDGTLSHAVLKRAKPGDYRIQSLYGGKEETCHPPPEDIAAAQEILDALPFEMPLYARIDMLRMEDGGLALMEVEMIEPYLYPEQGPQLGEKLAAAIEKRI